MNAENLQFLNNVSIMKTKVLLPQANLTFALLFRSLLFGFLVPKDLRVLYLPIAWLLAYMTEVIPGTRREHYIRLDVIAMNTTS